jgi:iron complex transport system substrate-binding protein
MRLRTHRLALVLTVAAAVGCGRFANQAKASASEERIVVIAQEYTEIIWALGAQDHVVAVDYSSNCPPAVKKSRPWGITGR